jgi:two-component system LytT family response regulator
LTASAVIADDEPLARQKLRELLADVSWIQCIGEAASGPDTVTIVNRTRPDLLFLDIRMPGHSGLEVLPRLRHRPIVVFTTAHDEFAVAAFEVRALDYLLKPFGRRRLAETLTRVRESLAATADVSAVERGRDALERGRPLKRLFVRTRGRITPIAVDEVTHFEARDDYVAIHAAAGRYLASLRIGDLEHMLDPDRFLRIHRSHIVNLDAVSAIEPHATGRLLVTLEDGTRLFASRARSKRIRRRAV